MTLRKALLSAIAATAFLATPALAHDCNERIEQIDRLLEEAAEAAISTSSGGQAVAGAREAQAMETDAAEETEDPVPFQEEPEEEEAVEEADEAGEGGDRVMQAMVALDEARAQADAGDEEACEAAVDDVLRTLIVGRQAS